MDMLKPQVQYPKLPRRKREKRLYGGAKTNVSVPVHYFDTRWADWYSGNILMNANYINSRTRYTLYTDGKSYINNADWKTKVAKGQDASANYSRQGISRYGLAKYSCRSEIWGIYQSTGAGSFCCSPTSTPKSYALLEEKAAARLKHKLQGYIGQAQLAAPLAESKEIHRLVRQINSLGMDALKAVLALRKTKGKSASKLFADIWLGYGFGIRPMLADIKSAADSILKYISRQDQMVVIRSGAREDWTSSQKVNMGLVCYGTEAYMYETSVHEQSVLITAGIRTDVRSAASYSVADHLGLNIASVPSTLWELTPYSWVVDYFTTVGPWLDDMFYTLPGVTVYIVSNKKYRCRTTGNVAFSVHPSFVDPKSRAYGGGSQSLVDLFSFSREKLAQLPSQSLRVKSMDEIASHGIAKMLNLASVIAGRHGGPSLR